MKQDVKLILSSGLGLDCRAPPGLDPGKSVVAGPAVAVAGPVARVWHWGQTVKG